MAEEPETPTGDVTDPSTNDGDDGEMPEILFDDEEAGPREDKASAADPEGKPAEAKEPEPSATDRKMAQMEGQIANLNKALHEARQSKKAATAEDPLTDDQLEAIYAEHKDDPKTVLRIIKYMAQQQASGVAGKHIEAQRISQVKAGVDSYVFQAFPGITEDGSSFRKHIDGIKQKYGLGDHPLSDAASIGMDLLFNFPAILQRAREEGKQQALDIKAEEGRQGGIKANALLKKGGSTKSSADIPSGDGFGDVLRMMSKGERATYKKLLANPKARSMSVEA